MYPVKISKQGRLVVPAELRKELGIEPDDDLVASAEDGKLVLKRRQAVIEELWAMFADKPIGLDEFIAEKRDEARREEEEDRRWLERAKTRS
jgi:AbrB family looped-hinge helix DNA binding protein